MMQIRVMDLVAVICCLVLPIAAECEEHSLISKSTFLYLSDAKKTLQPKGLTYVPAGTRIILYDDQTASYKGAERTRVLTENGLFAYIKEGEYYDPEELAKLKDQGRNTFIRKERALPLTFTSPEGVLQATLTFFLSRSEAYQLIEEDESHYTIELAGTDKLESMQPLGSLQNMSLKIRIPREIATVVDYSKDIHSKDVDYYERIEKNGISGLKKRCTWTDPRPIGNPQGNLSAFFNSASITDGDREKDELKAGFDGWTVERKYYRREARNGIYRLTKVTDECGTKDKYFEFSNPSGNSIRLDRTWSTERELPVHSDGSIFISCPLEYFMYEDELQSDEFEVDDVAFLLSRIAGWQDFGSECKSKRGRELQASSRKTSP